jgi:hypothetical protein
MLPLKIFRETMQAVDCLSPLKMQWVRLVTILYNGDKPIEGPVTGLAAGEIVFSASFFLN